MTSGSIWIIVGAVEALIFWSLFWAFDRRKDFEWPARILPAILFGILGGLLGQYFAVTSELHDIYHRQGCTIFYTFAFFLVCEGFSLVIQTTKDGHFDITL